MEERMRVSFQDDAGSGSFWVWINPRLADMEFRLGRFVVCCTGDVLVANAHDASHYNMVMRAHYAIRETPTGTYERVDMMFAGAWRKHGDDYGVTYQDMGLPYEKLRARLTTWKHFVGKNRLITSTTGDAWL